MTTRREIGDAIAVFAFELRAARRSVLVWLSFACTFAVGVLAYTRFALLHVAGDAPAPRFALPSFGLLALWVALPGLVAVVAGLRARDERAGIAEALDVRPLSNLALLCARTAAAVAPAWTCLVAIGVVLAAGGVAADRFHWLWLGESPEPVALATFLILDAPVTLLFWAAIATLLSATLRNPAAVMATVFGTLALAYFLLLHTPMHLLPAVAGIANLGLPGSEILPRYPAAADVAQRLAVLALAGGCLAASAIWLRRRDHIRRRLRPAAIGLAAAGSVGIGLLCAQAVAADGARHTWAAARLALRDAPRVDVERLTGRVDVDPGRQLTLDLTLQVRVPAELATTPMRFSLNPGLAVTSVTVAGEPADYQAELGMLAIAPPNSGTEAVSVGIRAAGRPDPRFGYPHSAIAASEENLLASGVALLGEQAVLFEEDFVALLPGGHWLPRADMGYSGALEAAGERDYRLIDLAVYAPAGWVLAGAGRNDSAGDDAARGVRFQPGTPLADFALLAAPWRRERAIVGGVMCELLLHAKHAPQVERVRHLATPLIQRYERNLRLTVRDGLGYPFAATGTQPVFSIVEAPAALRRYAGGEWMDSVQALPGVQLLAEHGFPTRRFEQATLEADSLDAQALESQSRRLDFLPMAGANGVPPAAGVWRNFAPFLTSGAGAAAPRMNLLLDVSTATPLHSGGSAVHSAASLVPGWRKSGLPRRLHRLFGMVSVGRPGGLAREVAQLAAALSGALGPQQNAATVVSLLRERHAGGHFHRSDFVAALRQGIPDFAPVVDNWLDDGALPGYVFSPVRSFRLPDDGRGAPRYQLLLHLRNDQPANGLVRLKPRTSGSFFDPSGSLTAVPALAAVELGAVLTAPPTEVQVETFLSLNGGINHGAARLAVPKVDPDAIVAEAAFAGARPSAWTPRVNPHEVLVDDLDEAFFTESVVTPGLRFTRRVVRATGPEVPGLGRGGETQWTRHEYDTAFSWGRYRRSLVLIRAGAGDSKATFGAVLPAAGRWHLWYHMPGPTLLAGSVLEDGPEAMRALIAYQPTYFGTFDIHVHSGGRLFPAPFDGGDAVPGWNALGTFDLSAGEVRVTVSDRSSGDEVVADAIRWLPADNEQASVPTGGA